MELLAYCGTPFLISKEHYEELSKFKWHISAHGYVVRSCKTGEESRLSRYILHNILKIDIENLQVDHKDRNPLNNQRSNLREVTQAENNRNKEKQDGCTSIYKGVCYLKNNNKWKANITIYGKLYNALYDNEIWAAHQYNLWLDEFNEYTGIKNKIDKPLDFIPWKKTERIQDLPKYIYETERCQFRVVIKYDNIRIHDSMHNTLFEAKIAKKEGLSLRDKIIKDKKNIKYNKDGEAIIEIFKYKNKICDVIIDEELYNDLVKIKWKIKTKNGKVDGRINNKYIEIQKYIMNHVDTKTIIFHVDSNILNNKLSNLIEIPRNIYQIINSPIISTGGSSRYNGVFYCNTYNKWTAKLCLTHIGYFKSEDDAYQARTNALEDLKSEYLPNYYFRKYFENLEL